MMPLVLRTLTCLDIDDILSLESGYWNRKSFVRYVRRKKSHGTIATNGSTVVAYAALEQIGAAVHVHRVFVHESIRLQGLGRAVLMEAASRYSTPSFVAKVPVDNVGESAFFAAIGFEEVKVVHGLTTAWRLLIARRP